MKKYIIETDEIIGCDKCSIKNKNNFNCNLYDEFKGCPFVELKPKQLKWEEKIDLSCVLTKKIFYEGEAGLFTYVIATATKGNKYYIANISSIEVFKTLDEAKQFCQDHYNKIFYEMIQ